jgi:hypothetical protein
VRFDHIVPMNAFIDRTELSDPSFDLTEEPFDFPVSLWVFNSRGNMSDVVKSQEFPEFRVSMLAVAS